MRLALNTDPWDYAGPMAYNHDMKRHILENGKPVDELEFIPDESDPEYSRDIWVVHKPSGKVNAYSAYLDEDGDVRMFNGIFDQKVDGKSDLLAMYKDDFVPEENYRSFDDERLDDEIKKLRVDRLEQSEVLGKLKKLYESTKEKDVSE